MSDEKNNTQHLDGENKSSPTGALAPACDRGEYDQRIAALPPGRREIAEELTTYADMCQFFERQTMDIPPHILRAVVQVSTLSDSERAAAMRQINQQLMEYLNDVGEDNGVRM